MNTTDFSDVIVSAQGGVISLVIEGSPDGRLFLQGHGVTLQDLIDASGDMRREGDQG